MQVYCCASNPPLSQHLFAINEPCHSDHRCRRIEGTMRSSITSIKVPSITPYEKILTQSRVWRSALNFVIASFFCAAICFLIHQLETFGRCTCAVWRPARSRRKSRLPHPLRTFVSTLCFGKKRIAQKGAHNKTAQDRPRQEERMRMITRFVLLQLCRDSSSG